VSVNVLCPRCPYFHRATEDCPPGWHDVRSEGGDHPAGGDGSGGGLSARQKAVGVAAFLLVAWVVVLLVIVTVALVTP
jgi:hypothetical protein